MKSVSKRKAEVSLKYAQWLYWAVVRGGEGAEERGEVARGVTGRDGESPKSW